MQDTDSKKLCRILALESSCDETAVAIVDGARHIHAETLRSQLAEHSPYGGVVPEIAARAHLDILPAMVQDCLGRAGIQAKDLDAVAVTSGPGLIGGLLVATSYAKAFAWAAGLPLYAINHLEGHALSPRFSDAVEFPYLLLLVSGGHSQFIVVEDVGHYRRIGTTIDDALGEAFDKAAKLLGLGYPGGAALEKLALSGDEKRFDLPRPLLGREGCDMSLSGLKTAVRHTVAALGQPSDQDRADIAASFQKAAADMLCDRAKNAIEIFLSRFKPAQKIFAIAGGVAANRYLKLHLEKLSAQYGFRLVAPPLNLCSDNAVMIAWAAIERMQKNFKAGYDFPALPRWPLDSLSFIGAAQS